MRKVQAGRWLLSLSLMGAVALAPHARVAAQEGKPSNGPPSAADQAFARGKERLARDDYAAACALLAESYQLDPATGSLLALALCHERQGKLASAFHEYEQVVARSQREGRLDREQAARVQVAALRSKLSTLTLRSKQPLASLVVRVNGIRIDAAQLREPLAIDGGFLLVQVEAEGKLPWQEQLTIADSGEALTLVIPTLESQLPEAAPAAAATRVQSSEVRREAAPPARPRLSATEIAGITLLAAGGAAAITSVGFTLSAVGKNHDSDGNCQDDVCTPEGRKVRLAAREAGDIATITALTATGVSAAGLIAYLVGRMRAKETRGPGTSALRVSGWLGPRGSGAALSGRF